MEKSLLTEVKAIVKSLVLSCPEKITIEQLNRDYRDVEGQNIPFRQLGYANLEEFLRSIPDTLLVFGSGPTAMVCFVANEKSVHIHDMIMKQKKPKTNTRSRSKNRSKSNSFQRNNNAFMQKPPIMQGQQFSSYQSVNRSHMAKTVQVRDVPHVVQRPNFTTPVINPLLYNLPQPNGILLNMQQHVNQQFNPVVSSIKNGIVKATNYQVQLNQINTLLTQNCIISNPPPPLPRNLTRSVKFSSERVSSIQVNKEIENESQNIDSVEITKPVKKSVKETINSPIQIKAPTAKKQIPIKLSEEVENILTMPKLTKVLNPIEEPGYNSNLEEEQKVENFLNIKPENPIKTKRFNKRFFDDTADSIEDPDEAVPSFAAKNNVFRLDFPECTVSYGDKIPSFNIPDEITVGSCIKIFVSEIHNPFKFWFHIHKDDNELDMLMYRIELYYSSLDFEDLRIPITSLTPGQVCATLYNGLWHRAEILAPPAKKNIKVLFMDYGTVAEVDIEKIKFLASVFAQLPAQAFRGCLSHIKPRQFHWSHDATTHFLNLVAELMLYAKITEIDREENVLYMILCDTNGDDVVQINVSLVENRHASYNVNWQTERISQNNGKRVRHPREEFPTFSMIESGEYPTFAELVSLEERGIDYEKIYDQVIYNQSTILNKHEYASEGLKNLPYFLTTSNPFRFEILLELHATTLKAI